MNNFESPSSANLTFVAQTPLGLDSGRSVAAWARFQTHTPKDLTYLGRISLVNIYLARAGPTDTAQGPGTSSASQPSAPLRDTGSARQPSASLRVTSEITTQTFGLIVPMI